MEMKRSFSRRRRAGRLKLFGQSWQNKWTLSMRSSCITWGIETIDGTEPFSAIWSVRSQDDLFIDVHRRSGVSTSVLIRYRTGFKQWESKNCSNAHGKVWPNRRDQILYLVHNRVSEVHSNVAKHFPEVLKDDLEDIETHPQSPAKDIIQSIARIYYSIIHTDINNSFVSNVRCISEVECRRIKSVASRKSR